MEIDTVTIGPRSVLAGPSSYSDDEDENEEINGEEGEEEEVEEQDPEVEVEAGDDEEVEEDEGEAEQAAPKVKAKRVIKSRQSLAEKQPGTTIFPIARVKRIIKADKEVDNMSAEATFLIAAATEYFIQHFMEEGYTKARLDKRKLINYRDLASVCARSDEFSFLQDVVPIPMQMSEALEKRKQKQMRDENPTIYDENLAASGSSDVLPPLAGSTNPLFPNAIVRRPVVSHAKGKGAVDPSSELTEDDDEAGRSGKNGSSAASAPAVHGHGTRKARQSMSTIPIEIEEPIEASEEEDNGEGEGSPIEID